MNATQRAGEIDIQGRVLEYGANALTEDFAGGGHRGHDATTLELLAPLYLRGTQLVIYHDAPAAPQSPWRSLGATLNFSLDAEMLEDGVQVFSGAARDVRTTDAPIEPGK